MRALRVREHASSAAAPDMPRGAARRVLGRCALPGASVTLPHPEPRFPDVAEAHPA
jgi:hypothetical protein